MYATIDEVQARMPQFPLTATSKPSLADAQVLLDDTEAELNVASENMGYVTPLTGVKTLSLARTIVVYGAIAKILNARGAAVGGDITFQSADRAQTYFENYLKALKDPKNPLEFTDAVRTGAAIMKPQLAVLSFGTDPAVLAFDPLASEPRCTMDQVFGFVIAAILGTLVLGGGNF